MKLRQLAHKFALKTLRKLATRSDLLRELASELSATEAWKGNTWETDFESVDEGSGWYWAFVNIEPEEGPEWFVVEIHHHYETCEPAICGEPSVEIESISGWGPRIPMPWEHGDAIRKYGALAWRSHSH